MTSQTTTAVELPDDDVHEIEHELDRIDQGLGAHEEGRTPWSIAACDDPYRAAEWAMARVAEVQQIAAEYQAMADHYAREAKRISRRADHLTGCLKEWGLSVRSKERKSISLYRGTISTRSSAERIALGDETAAVVWAEANAPDAVQIVKTTTLTRLTEATGAVIADAVVAVHGINRETGESQTAEQWDDADAPLLDDDLRAVWADGDPWQYEFETIRVVVTEGGERIPGLYVVPASASASVKVAF